MAYRIEWTPRAQRQMRHLTARERSLIDADVERQLVHEPLVQTRNRKPRYSPAIAPWELRVRHLRVYYRVDEGDVPTVWIVTVGRKRGADVIIPQEDSDREADNDET